MSGTQDKAADVLGPTIDGIAVVAITTSSAGTDMSAEAQLGPEFRRQFVTMIFDVGTYYAWGPSGATIDETATSGSTRTAFLPANTPISEKPTGDFLYLKGTGAGKARLWTSSSRG